MNNKILNKVFAVLPSFGMLILKIINSPSKFYMQFRHRLPNK